MKELGELIYEYSFKLRIHHKNDGNGHLNNSFYHYYSESIRQKFLKSFDWEDGNFNGKEISMLMGKREVKYKKSLKERDKIKIVLGVFFKRNPFFHMVYTFYNPLNEIAVIDKTIVSFANSKTGKTRNVPDFFLESIRNC